MVCSLQVYWCGPLLGGVGAALLYETVFAANACMSKARGYLLASDYNSDDYEQNPERPVEVRVSVTSLYIPLQYKTLVI